jgi:hypothetical protein
MALGNEIVDDLAKEAEEDAAKTAGEAAVEASVKDALENVEKNAKDLLNSTDSSRDSALAMLGQSSTASEDEIANSMKDAINKTGKDVSTEITERSTAEIGAAKDEANSAVREAEEAAQKDNKTLTDAEKEAKAKEVFDKPKYNYGKLSGTIMKYSALAAVAILMLKNFFSKLDKPFTVQKITLNGDYVTFTICDGADFADKDSFTFSGFGAPYTYLNTTKITLSDSAGPTIIKVKKSDLPSNSVNENSDPKYTCLSQPPLGIMTCSPDLASNLLHSTGEVLDDVIKTADDALNKIGNDLGLGGLLGGLKWILIGAAVIFFIVLLYWVYKTFVKK